MDKSLNIRKILFFNYTEELSQYSHHINLTNKEIEENFYYLIEDYERCTWHDIIYEDQIVGFVITRHKPIEIKGSNLYFEACYILPSHRKKGLMSKKITTIISEYPHNYIYSLCILEKNLQALEFWSNYTSKNNFTMNCVEKSNNKLISKYTIKKGNK